MKHLRLVLPALFLLISFVSFGQEKPAATAASAPIKWMSFEEAVERNKTEPKKMFIDVYTHWCGWCKRMDATTFIDPAIADYMNKKFYAVKLDAERKDTVHFADKIFVYKPESKANELAISLLNGQMSYPSFVFLDEKFAMLTPLAGYQQADQLLRILKYFGDDIYTTKKWDDYAKEAAGGN